VSDRSEALRKRARRHGLRMVKRGDTFELRDGETVLRTGSARDAEQYLDAHSAGARDGRIHPLYTLPQEWQRAVDDWTGWLRLSGMSPMTVRLRYDHVRVMARRLESARPADVTLADLVRVCSAHTWSNEHRKGVRTSLVSFFDWCISSTIADVNPAAGLPLVLGDKPRPRPATDDIWRHLIATAPQRELLMIRLAGEAGLRRGEVALCHRDDLITDPRGPSLIVHGKGNKQRVVPISDSLAEAIREECRGVRVPRPLRRAHHRGLHQRPDQPDDAAGLHHAYFAPSLRLSGLPRQPQPARGADVIGAPEHSHD
jgi:integrase